MREHNADTLRAALAALPQHTPPPAVWSSVRAGLGQPTELAERLPQHQPPVGVWNAINAELGERARGDAPPASPAAGRVQRLPARRWAGVAAALLLLLAAAFTFRAWANEPTVTVAYAQEPAPTPVVKDWDDNEDSFRRAIAEVEARDEPALNTLRHELDELTAAREEVKAMLVSYGEDPGVVRQLAEIERDRSDIYRRIIVEL